jgi:putative sterol carrier protein
MSAFKSDNEVYDYIGEMFRRAVQDPEFSSGTADSGLTLLIKQTNPDARILVDFGAQQVTTGEAVDDGAANVVLRMSSDNANRFWQGKLNFTLAMAQRKVKLEGRRSVAMKLLPLTKTLFAQYQSLLADGGRVDLVVD